MSSKTYFDGFKDGILSNENGIVFSWTFIKFPFLSKKMISSDDGVFFIQKFLKDSSFQMKSIPVPSGMAVLPIKPKDLSLSLLATSTIKYLSSLSELEISNSFFRNSAEEHKE